MGSRTHNSTTRPQPSTKLILPSTSITPIQQIEQILIAPITRSCWHTRHNTRCRRIATLRSRIPLKRNLIYDVRAWQSEVLKRGFTFYECQCLRRCAEMRNAVLHDVGISARYGCGRHLGTAAAECSATGCRCCGGIEGCCRIRG